MVLASSATDWISSTAALAGTALATAAILLAVRSIRNAEEAKEISLRSASLERQKVLGSIVGVQDVAGLSFEGQGVLAVMLADYAPRSRRPEVTYSGLFRSNGSPFGTPLIGRTIHFQTKGRGYSVVPPSEVRPPLSPRVVPLHLENSEKQAPDSDYVLGVLFRLSPAELAEVDPRLEGEIVDGLVYRLPTGLTLRLKVSDPLGVQGHLCELGDRTFGFCESSWLGQNLDFKRSP